MIAIVVANSGMPSGWETAARTSWLMITPVSAPKSVTAIAARERNRAVSRRIAIAMPTSSPTGSSCSAATSSGWPRSSTWAPPSSASRAVSSSASPCSFSSSVGWMSYWTVANAVRPSC